jgi:hypothetical protein
LRRWGEDKEEIMGEGWGERGRDVWVMQKKTMHPLEARGIGIFLYCCNHLILFYDHLLQLTFLFSKILPFLKVMFFVFFSNLGRGRVRGGMMFSSIFKELRTL